MAGKRGISNEYVYICTGIYRKGDTIAASVNRAKSCALELLRIFESYIADRTLALYDGLRGYHALLEILGIAACTVRNCTNQDGADACFFNLNTVNGFHSLIKRAL